MDPGKRKGYAKLRGVVGLDGPDMTWIEFHLKNLKCVLGRKSKNNNDIDVCLGDDKSISREHLKIQWNTSKRVFELFVIGKNGVRVDGNSLRPEKNGIPLQHQTRLQLGDSILYFLLPQGAESKAKLIGSEKEKNVKEGKRPAQAVTGGQNQGGADGPPKKKKKKSLAAIAQDAAAEKHRREYDHVLFKILKEKEMMRFSDLCDYLKDNAPHLVGELDTTTWRGRLSQRLSTSDKYVKVPDENRSKLNYWRIAEGAVLERIDDPELESKIASAPTVIISPIKKESEDFKASDGMVVDDDSDDDDDDDGAQDGAGIENGENGENGEAKSPDSPANQEQTFDEDSSDD